MGCELLRVQQHSGGHATASVDAHLRNAGQAGQLGLDKDRGEVIEIGDVETGVGR